MSNLRKSFTIAVSALTILWSVGVTSVASFAVSTAQAADVTLQAGDLIKSTTNSAVYYFDGSKRFVFFNKTVYDTWYSSFSGVKTISATQMGNIMIGGNVTIRPGTMLVKVVSDPSVYAVSTGGVLNKIDTEARATKLYGSMWYKNVVDVQDFLFSSYKSGSAITSDMYPDGAVIKYAGSSNYYLVQGSSKRMFASAQAMAVNNINTKYAQTTDITYADGTAITGYEASVGSVTGGVVTPPTPTGNIAAALAADTPASGTLVATQSLGDLAHFNFTGTGTITAFTFERIGVSGNTTLSNVYLFDGSTRLTDSASVSSDNKITFSGLSVAVSGTKNIAVKSDILTGTSGQTVGVKLTSYTVSGVVSTVSLSGNLHTIATSTLATLAMSSATGSGNTDPGNDVNVWQGTATVATRDLTLNRFALRQVGSIVSTDIKNFRLFVDGTLVATTANLDSTGYVTFTPNVVVKTGARVVKVMADVIGGSGRTVAMSLRGAYDINATDTSYNVNVLATGTFPFGPSAFTVNAGTLTVAKATDSPSTNLVVGASDISVGKWTFTAYGETVKVETLTVGVDTNGTDANNSFRNVRVMVDGSQVGSTTSVAAVNSYASGTSFTTNFYVTPGTPRVVEVRSDMVDDTGTDLIANATTTSAQFALVIGSSNAVPQVSLTPIAVPTASVPANTLTISSGTIALAATANYPAQTIAAPQTAYKLGSWTLTGNSTEAVNVNTFTLSVAVTDTDSSGSLTTAGDVTDVYVKYGSKTTAVKSTIAASGNTWSPSFTLGVNETMQVDVYATLSSDFTATDTVAASLLVSGTTAQSGTSVSTNSGSVLAGQTITVNAGTITATLDASAPIAQLVDDTGTVTTAAFKFAAVTDSYTVTDITITLGNATTVSGVTLKDGATVVGASKPGATSLTWSGLSIPVAANTNKVITVELALSSVGVGAGTSDSAITTTLTDFTARGSAGTSYASSGSVAIESNPAGNAMYVRKAVPLVTQVALPNADLAASTAVIAKFTVSSNGTGTIAWKQVMLEITKTATPVLATPTLWNADTGAQVNAYVVFQNTTDTTTACDADSTSCEALITVDAASDSITDDDYVETVSGAKTYEVRSAITGSIATTDSVSVKLDRNSTSHTNKAAFTGVDNATTANSSSFVWSDESASATNDTGVTTWEDDYLVKSLPLNWSLN